LKGGEAGGEDLREWGGGYYRMERLGGSFREKQNYPKTQKGKRKEEEKVFVGLRVKGGGGIPVVSREVGKNKKEGTTNLER